MSDAIAVFFECWQIEDADLRFNKLSAILTGSIQYDDPRITETVKGVEALNDYIGMFSVNAPGWSAKVVRSDTVSGLTRATVKFSGPGTEGQVAVQFGQYFVEKKGELLDRIVGFVGTGEPQ